MRVGPGTAHGNADRDRRHGALRRGDRLRRRVDVREPLRGRARSPPPARRSPRPSRIRVGIGTVSPYTRSPAIVAMEAGLLQPARRRALFPRPGRESGGAGGPARHRRDQAPHRHARDAHGACVSWFAGRSTTFAGERVRLRDVTLALPKPAEGPPLYLGAIGERMLGLAGQLADGLIFSVLCPLPFIRRALGPRGRRRGPRPSVTPRRSTWSRTSPLRCERRRARPATCCARRSPSTWRALRASPTSSGC